MHEIDIDIVYYTGAMHNAVGHLSRKIIRESHVKLAKHFTICSFAMVTGSH